VREGRVLRLGYLQVVQPDRRVVLGRKRRSPARVTPSVPDSDSVRPVSMWRCVHVSSRQREVYRPASLDYRASASATVRPCGRNCSAASHQRQQRLAGHRGDAAKPAEAGNKRGIKALVPIELPRQLEAQRLRAVQRSCSAPLQRAMQG
jgi:hypothetical protein